MISLLIPSAEVQKLSSKNYLNSLVLVLVLIKHFKRKSLIFIKVY